jgi:hypothetical protein
VFIYFFNKDKYIVHILMYLCHTNQLNKSIRFTPPTNRFLMNKQLTSSCAQTVMPSRLMRFTSGALQTVNGFRIKTLRCLLLLLSVSLTTSVFAQTSYGKDFWLMFNDNSLGGSPTLSLFITSNVNTSGVVEIAGLAYTQAFTVTANTVTTVILPNTVAILSSDVIENKAIHITSVADVVVYGLNRRAFTTDAFLGIPTNALGLEHLIMSYVNLSSTVGGQLGVVASEDNTNITITPKVNVTGHLANIPYTITLNRNQAYQVKSVNNGDDLTGTVVIGDKPISVFGSHLCANVPINVGYCDHLVEQLPATTTWGKNFITGALLSRTGGDIFRVLAATSGTVVRLNGVMITTLNRGEFRDLDLPSNSYNVITTSEPSLVAQFSKGSDADGVTSDPFMTLVPPNEQYFGSTIFSTPATGFANNFVNIITPSAGVGLIQLDGVTIPAADYTAIGISGYFGVRKPLALGSHQLTAPNVAFNATVYGFDGFDSYGYPAGQAYGKVATATFLTLSPTTQTLNLLNNGCVTATLTDQDNLPLAGARIDFVGTGVNAGAGFGFTDALGQVTYCYTGTNGGLDNIVATLGSLSATATINWNALVTPLVSLSVLPSSPICAGTSVTFTATPTFGGTTPIYKWFKNNVVIPGATANTLITNTLVNADAIKVELTSNAADLATPTALSTPIVMSVVTPILPDFQVYVVGGVDRIEVGIPLTYRIFPINVGVVAAYQWFKNGLPVGTNADNYTDTALQNGDILSCRVTNSGLCPLNATQSARAVTVIPRAACNCH